MTPDSKGEMMVSGLLLHTRMPEARADEGGATRPLLLGPAGRKQWTPTAMAAAANRDALLTILLTFLSGVCVYMCVCVCAAR